MPWDSKKFNFRNKLSGELTPAMVVRLPGGDYWAFSLEEPFKKCELELVKDVVKLQSEYGYAAAAHPMVVSPCSRTVYDLMRFGAAPGGLVRGEVVQGTGLRPPIAIEVRVQGHQIMAARME